MTYTVSDPTQHFYLYGGGRLSSLNELFSELQTMEQDVFDHHVSESHNDFAQWVRHVMDDRMLARNIELAKTKDQLLKLLFMSLFK